MKVSKRQLHRGLLLAAVSVVCMACDHGKLDGPPMGPQTLDAEGMKETAQKSGSSDGPMAGGPMAGGPMAGGPMAGGPMAGGPMAGGPMAGGPMAGGGAANPASGPAITGEITLAPQFAAAIPPGAVVFVLARPEGMDKGPPLATARFPATFPLSFRLGPENVMLQGVPWQGKVNLSARLDGDGNAMSKGAGDVMGSPGAPIEVGATEVKFELNQPL